MNRKERALYIILAFTAGLLGGVSAGHLSRATAAPLIPASAAPPPAAHSVITAQKLVIVDKDGKNRAEFGSEPNAAVSIVMYDAKGQRRLGIGASEKGPGLNIFERDGKTLRLALHLTRLTTIS